MNFYINLKFNLFLFVFVTYFSRKISNGYEIYKCGVCKKIVCIKAKQLIEVKNNLNLNKEKDSPMKIINNEEISEIKSQNNDNIPSFGNKIHINEYSLNSPFISDFRINSSQINNSEKKISSSYFNNNFPHQNFSEIMNNITNEKNKTVFMDNDKGNKIVNNIILANGDESKFIINNKPKLIDLIKGSPIHKYKEYNKKSEFSGYLRKDKDDKDFNRWKKY